MERERRRPTPLLRAALWANVVMAGSAAGWVVATIRLAGLPMDGVLVALAVALAVAFYTRDRLDEEEQHADATTMPARTAWVRRHARVLRGLVRGAFVSALALLAWRPTALPPLLAGVGVALSYTTRWLPWRGRRVGWKHLPGLKMPVVAALWVLLTVVTPLVVYGRLWTGSSARLAGAVWVLVMVQILLNDLRDVAGDRWSGTASLPVLWGEQRARRAGYALLVGAGALAWPLASLALPGAALYSAYLLWRYRREDDDQWRFWIEAQGIVAGGLALLA